MRRPLKGRNKSSWKQSPTRDEGKLRQDLLISALAAGEKCGEPAVRYRPAADAKRFPFYNLQNGSGATPPVIPYLPPVRGRNGQPPQLRTPGGTSVPGTENDEPQPQVRVARGFWNTKPFFIKLSW